MANSKKIKLETIGEKAKRKKDFLIVISIVLLTKKLNSFQKEILKKTGLYLLKIQ